MYVCVCVRACVHLIVIASDGTAQTVATRPVAQMEAIVSGSSDRLGTSSSLQSNDKHADTFAVCVDLLSRRGVASPGEWAWSGVRRKGNDLLWT